MTKHNISYQKLLAEHSQMRQRIAELEQKIGVSPTTSVQQETHLQTLFEAMQSIILVLDTTGRYLEIPITNPHLLYQPASDLLGKTLHEVLPPDQADIFLDCIQRVHKSNHPMTIDYTLPIDRDTYRFRAIVSPLSETSVVWIARDITQEQQMEDALLESELRYRLLIEYHTDAMVVDSQGIVCYANPAAANLFGKTPDELVGQSIGIPVIEGDKTEVELHTSDGSMITAEMRVVDIFWEDAPAHLTTFRDITSQKDMEQALAHQVDERTRMLQQVTARLLEELTQREKAEKALRQSEERFRMLMDNAPDIIYRYRFIPTRCYEYISPAITAITGYTPEEFYADPDMLLKIAHPTIRPVFAPQRRALHTQNEPLIICLLHKDGSEVWIEQRLWSIFDDDDRLIAVEGLSRDITQQKRAEEALRESEARYRLMADNLTDMISRHAPDGSYTYVSPSCKNLLGYIPQEMVGCSAYSFVHPEDISIVRVTHGAVSNQTDVFSTSYRIRHKEGHYIWFETTCKTIRNSNTRSIQEIIAVSRDVTRRKQTEDLLAWQAQVDSTVAQLAQRLLLQSSLVANAAEILQTLLTLTSSTAGYIVSKDIHTGTPIFHAFKDKNHELLLSPDQAVITQTFGTLPAVLWEQQAIVRTNSPHTHAIGNQIQQGNLPLVRLLAAPACIAPDIDGYLVVMNAPQDYTSRDQILIEHLASLFAIAIQRAHTEAALRQNQRLLKTIISNAPLVLCAIDKAGIITLADGKGLSAVGSAPGRNVGKNIFDMYSHEPQTLEPMQRALQGEDVATVIQVGDMTFDKRCSPVYDEHGEINGVIDVSLDITERQKGEEAQHQARLAAESANRMKTEFLANMSHEIRTPMNAIIGLTSLLLDTNLDAEQQEYVETVRISSDTLLTLINDILDFSKIEAGRIELEQHPFNLRDCLEESLELIMTKAEEKGLELACMVDSHTPLMLIGDSTRLRQILVNLLSNAVKFTEQGEVVVAVTSEEVGPDDVDGGASCEPSDDQSRVMLHIQVRDTGIGITPEHMRNLFKSFSQGDPSTTRKYGGSGLGLVISKRFAEMMGGAIWAESQPGVGSTFHVTGIFPVDTAQTHIPVDTPPMEVLLEPLPMFQDKRLLIVSQETTNCILLKQYILTWGIVPFTSESDEQILEWIQQGQTFDAVVFDINPHTEQHVQLISKIRNLASCQQLPIIVCTNVRTRMAILRRMPLPHTDRELDPEHVTAFLMKPVCPAMLHTLFATLFSSSDSLPPITTHSTTLSRSLVWDTIDRTMGKTRPLRILLAEDNAINQKVTLGMLEKIGYQADRAWNGLEVIKALKHQRYDLILMDVQMPEMDGIEATMAIRNQFPPEKQPYIIAITAHAMQGVQEHLLNVGMDAYVSKPVKMEDLVAALQKVTGEQTVVLAEEQPQAERPQQAAHAGKAADRIDPLALQTLLHIMHNEQAIEELITIFFTDAPAHVARLQEMQNGADMPKRELLARTAHSLKSMSAQLGAIQLSACCKQIEDLAKTASPGEIAELVRQTVDAYEYVEQTLPDVWAQVSGS